MKKVSESVSASKPVKKQKTDPEPEGDGSDKSEEENDTPKEDPKEKDSDATMNATDKDKHWSESFKVKNDLFEVPVFRDKPLEQLINHLVLKSDKSSVCSPMSIFLSLYLLCDIARRETQDQLEDFLGNRDKYVQGVPFCFASLMEYYKDSPLKLLMITLARSKKFTQHFDRVSEIYFDAGIIDDDRATKEWANGVVAKQTNQMIDQVLKEEVKDEDIILLSTMHFLDMLAQSCTIVPIDKTWKFPLDTQVLRSPMTKHVYYSDANVQVARVPYKNDKLDLVVVLSKEEIKEFSVEDWNKWSENKAEVEGTIVLPQFDTSSHHDLKSILEPLGITHVFSKERANLSEMIEGGGHLTQMLHACRFQFDKDGTSTVAATTRVPLTDSTFEMVCDRDFLYFLCDPISNTIVAAGRHMFPRAS